MTSLNLFCNTKDKTPTLNQSFVVYEFVCPGCSANYVGKTERTLFERNVEHAWNDKDSVVNIHLNECNGVQHVFNITTLTPSLFSDSIVDDVQDLRTSRKRQLSKGNYKALCFPNKTQKANGSFFFFNIFLKEIQVHKL